MVQPVADLLLRFALGKVSSFALNFYRNGRLVALAKGILPCSLNNCIMEVRLFDLVFPWGLFPWWPMVVGAYDGGPAF